MAPGAVAWVTMAAAVVSGPAVTPVGLAVSPGSAVAGWLVTADLGAGGTGPGTPRASRWTVLLTADAAVAGAGGALLAGPATVLVAVRATVPVTLPVTADTTLADVAVAGADVAGTDGSGWLWGCDPADWPGAAGPPPWVTLWTVWLTLARAPPAGDWPGPPLGVPDGACPGGVLTAAAPAAGPVLWPPDPPGKMSWVTTLTADAAALAAGVLVAGPGRRLWAVPATEPAVEVTLPGRPAVTPLRPAEPGFCAGPGFWPAEARPARSTAQTSAAAKPPHAYRQTLRTSTKARERVADPFTANTLPPDPDNDPYPGSRRTPSHLRPCPGKGRLPA
jgi:hypothetical protein